MVHIIIPSGGKGLRFGTTIPKQYLELNCIPILVRTLLRFENEPLVSKIHIAAESSFIDQILLWKKEYSIYKLETVVEGASERQFSIYEVLKSITFTTEDIILVHDAVRPFPSNSLIQRIIEKTLLYGACIPTLPITDTIKRKNNNNSVVETLDRSELVSVQTPQGFRASVLINAYEFAVKNSILGTDDSSLVERIGVNVYCEEGEITNIKITNKEDIVKAEQILLGLKKILH